MNIVRNAEPFECIYCGSILILNINDIPEEFRGEVVADAEVYHFETVHMGDDEEVA